MRNISWKTMATATFVAGALGLAGCTAGNDDGDKMADADTDASAGTNPDYPDIEFAPEYNDADELKQPVDFREWVFIGAPLTPNGLNGGEAGFPEYHNVYVQPSAFKAYRATGEWPEGTMMVKELQLVKGSGETEDGSRTEPSGRGYFPGPVNGMDVSVKDSKRYSDTDNWGYFNFNHSAPPYLAYAPALPKDKCAFCHIASADEDMVFVNFYKPILDPLPLPEAGATSEAPAAEGEAEAGAESSETEG